MGITLGAAIGSRAAGCDVGFSRRRTRHITPEAGRALEILAHAIEYLTDEYVHEKKLLGHNDQQLEAIQLLMSLNRQIYYECPAVTTILDWILPCFYRD